MFRLIDSAELSLRLGAWLERLHGAPKDDQPCIDGKAIRRALEASGSPVHVVNAWATRARMALGQVEVDTKENEIVAIPKLLGLLHRRTWACEELSWFADHARWAGLKSVVVQRNTRESKGKTTESLNTYVSSRPAKDVEALARAARGHWAVENSLHWVLDMAFDEDRSRARRDHAALNLAALRRVVVSVVRKNTTLKCGAATKRKCAGWNRDYLTQVLLCP